MASTDNPTWPLQAEVTPLKKCSTSPTSNLVVPRTRKNRGQGWMWTCCLLHCPHIHSSPRQAAACTLGQLGVGTTRRGGEGDGPKGAQTTVNHHWQPWLVSTLIPPRTSIFLPAGAPTQLFQLPPTYTSQKTHILILQLYGQGSLKRDAGPHKSGRATAGLPWPWELNAVIKSSTHQPGQFWKRRPMCPGLSSPCRPLCEWQPGDERSPHPAPCLVHWPLALPCAGRKVRVNWTLPLLPELLRGGIRLQSTHHWKD